MKAIVISEHRRDWGTLFGQCIDHSAPLCSSKERPDAEKSMSLNIITSFGRSRRSMVASMFLLRQGNRE